MIRVVMIRCPNPIFQRKSFEVPFLLADAAKEYKIPGS